jgi:Spy/CpxP family protein refolding chaperone
MKTKVLVGLLLFLIVINLSTIGVFVYHLLSAGPRESEPPALAGGGPEGAMGLDSPMMHMKPEVRDRMHALMMHFREDVSGLQQEGFALLKIDPPPMDRVNANLKKLSDLRLSINQMAVHNLLQAKSFLTPEQQDMFFRAIMQARPQAGRMGSGGMGRGQMWGRQRMGGPGRLDSNQSH